MNGFLTDEERKTLKVEHKKERDGRVRDRIKAVLLYDEGWSFEKIAHVLLLSDEAIRQHIQDYQSLNKLKPQSGGSESKLNEEQSKFLEEHLQKHVYLFVKDIIAYVKTSFGIEYTVPGMRGWLLARGFTYKKPSVVPGKANYEVQKQWIEEYKLLKSNLGPDEAICFIDGVHPTHNMKAAYGWMKKGERKEIPTNTGRQRLNLSGSIDIQSKEVLIHHDVTLNAASTIEFLTKLEASYPTKKLIYVFCDNARYYRNKDVVKFLETSKISMQFLPPYSPNLNAIERLWKLLNERVLYNKYYEKFLTFKNAVYEFFEGTSDLKEVLNLRVTDNFRPIGLAIANF